MCRAAVIGNRAGQGEATATDLPGIGSGFGEEGGKDGGEVWKVGVGVTAMVQRFAIRRQPEQRLGAADVSDENHTATGAAMGAVTSSPAQRFTLQQGDPLATAPCLVVGAGTGLGMAIVLPEHGAWRIVAGEGGHVAFAPADEQQMALWTFLHARHGRVTWERVVSGPGLTAINELVAGISLSPEQIADRALADPTGAERRSLDMFLAAYGAFAGDMALACLARGGVFLAGGIAAKLLPVLRQSGFLAAFKAKAEHAAIAARMPIHVATDPLLGLRGALRLARNNS